MPRQGDGSSQNGPIEATHDIGHGIEPTNDPHVSRADKTADLPEGRHEKGGAIEGMNASGGGSQGIKQGDDVGQGGRGSSN